MSDWRPSVIAATLVLFGGGFVGAVTTDRSEENAETTSQARSQRGEAGSDSKGRGTGESTSRGTDTTSPGIEVTPPAATRAPDTLTELKEGGQIEDDGTANFGTHTIADKSYEGVTMNVDRSDTYGTPKLPIKTKGRYKRLRGVVGISAETDCPRNEASVSITDDQGKNLWGPNRVSFNEPKRFDIPIKGLASLNLVQRSLAPSGGSGGSCLPGIEEADPAYGQVEFVK